MKTERERRGEEGGARASVEGTSELRGIETVGRQREND